MNTSTAAIPTNPASVLPAPTASRYRWWIVLLLFFATTINYVDRQLFANLIPYFEDELRIGPMDLAYINAAFVLTYGLSMTLVGRFIDRVGVRVGLALTFLVWTMASVGHALVFSVLGFIVIRIILGIGEAGNFPSSIKAVAEWFPKRERALATGWFNCGSNIGAVVTPLLVPWIAIHFGWRACFAALSGIGLIWLFFWGTTYRSVEGHPKVSSEEAAYIRSDPPDVVAKVPALVLLGQRPLYAIALARFFTESPWWFYLTWMPKLLSDRFGLNDYQRALAVAFIYLIADLGAIGGGWISSRLIKRGHTVNFARKTAMLIVALGTLPVISLVWLEGVTTVFGLSAAWIAVPIVALAASCHQGWSSNMYTIISDTLPKDAVATTVGIGTAFGSIGSALFQFLVAFWLMQTGNYALPMVLAGSLYLMGWLVLHLLLPRIEPARIDPNQRPKVRPWHVAVGAAVIIGGLVALQAILTINQYPYRSLAEYLEKRGSELHATTHILGPTAKVGWQDAQWIVWKKPDGTIKRDLVKLDLKGRPTIEGGGATAKKYAGPPKAEIEALSP
ncbi:MAG: MFS transporter [Tepidisphaeraceae bacterium]